MSYASEDRDRAQKMAALLEARGWTVWWDRKILAGQTYDEVIEHELETAKCVVVLWSKHSTSSEWVKNEAAVAGAKGVLVPALIDPVKLPLEFRRKQTTDLAGWNGQASHLGLSSLFDGIAAIVSGGLQPPARAQPLPVPLWQHRRTWLIVTAVVVSLGMLFYWREYWRKNSWREVSQPPVETIPSSGSLREEVYRQLATDQRAAFALLEKRAPGALAAIDANLAKNNQAIASFPGDPTFLVLKGYTLKDAYQLSKGLLPLPKRRVWLAEARRSFEQALRLAPNDASANNGLGNVLFFEGSFDAALHQHELALKLRGGNYSEAASDKELVLSVKRGERPLDF